MWRQSARALYYNHLTRNMIFTILLVSFIPVFLVALIIYHQFAATYERKLYAHLTVLVENHKKLIDDFLNARLADIQYMADSDSYANLSDEAFLQAKLIALQKNYGHIFVDLGVVNSAGKQVSYAGPFQLSKVRYADAAWFQKVLVEGTVISDVFLGLRGVPHFTVAVRLEHEGYPWVLRATIDFVAFNDLVENINIGETGFAFIVNEKGELQTRPRLDVILTEGCYAGFVDCSRGELPEIQIEEHLDRHGVQCIFVMALMKNHDWMLVYKQVRSDAYAGLLRARNASIVVFVLGGIAIVMMAGLLSKRMVNRIAQADQEKELMNKQVIQSGKLASLGELATGVAHEINNPVAIMVEEAGWIGDLLAEKDFSSPDNMEEIRRALQQINTQGKRCKDITTKLLSFARGSGTAIRYLQINQVIEEVINLSAQRAKYANIEMHSDLEKNLPQIMASETEMHQVFLNLTNNAIRAMENTGGSLSFKTYTRNRRLMVEVTDTGPGIPQAIINRIFDPFFTTKPVGQGTGLGLSICYGIIRKMDGDIQVSSGSGKGTRFVLTLPLEDTDTVLEKAQPD